MSKNLRIWNAVKYTDPGKTKQATLPGGFKATAVDPNWLMQRATELFGPCGIGFGWSFPFPPFVAGDLAVVTIRMWYILEGERGEFDVVAGNDLSLRRKESVSPDSDAFKKALTDAVKNGLTKLGFLADIHQGKHDDATYVEWASSADGQAKIKAAAASLAAPAAPPAPSSDPPPPVAPAAPDPPPRAPTPAALLTLDQQANVLFLKLKSRDPGLAQDICAKNADAVTQVPELARALGRLLFAELKAKNPGLCKQVVDALPKGTDGKFADAVQAAAAAEAALGGVA